MITLAPLEFLDGKHTQFGEIVKGWDTLKLLEKEGSKLGTPRVEIKITSCSIIEKSKWTDENGKLIALPVPTSPSVIIESPDSDDVMTEEEMEKAYYE